MSTLGYWVSMPWEPGTYIGMIHPCEVMELGYKTSILLGPCFRAKDRRWAIQAT